jgi:pyruvate, water dikinase
MSTEDGAMDTIRSFSEIGLPDVGLVGRKGANLGDLTAAGMPVPPGFVVSAAANLEAVASPARGPASRASSADSK